MTNNTTAAETLTLHERNLVERLRDANRDIFPSHRNGLIALIERLTSPRAAVPVVGYLCDSPAEPDIGYWFSEEPDTTHRCRALGFVDAAPDGWASSWIGINREAAQQTALDHGFKIWHRPESFGVAGTTRQAEELLACLLGVEVEIDAAPAAPVAEAEPAPDPLRRRVERLLVELHAEGRLSEGQCAKMLNISRVEWRELAEFLAPAAQAVAADGATTQANRTSNGLWDLADEMDANGWKDDALTLRLLLSAHDVESVVSMMKALQFIDSELTEYLEGMPADETSRKLRDVARDALNVERAAVSPATADRIPDECAASGGSCSYAPDGRHGEMQCRYCGKEKTATADERHEDGLLTTEALISIIERHFDHDHPDGQRLVEMAQDVAASQHKQGEPATAEDGGWAAFEPWFERAWLLNPDKDFSDRIRCKAWAWKTWKHLRGEAPATADTTGYCTRSVCGCEGSRIETKQGCYHWRIVSETATADERAALREMLDDARNEFTMVREALGVAYEPHQTLLERTLDAARASQAAAPQANAAEESEDAYVIRRLSETLADVAVTLRGDDPVHPDDPLNKIELVKRLAEVLRMEVELYRAQAAAPADAREPQWSRDIIADLQGLFDTDGITENDSGDALIRLSDAIAAVENARAGAPADAGEAVGVADSMPGTSGFTMACFEAAKVPIGTKLYAAAQGGKGGEA